MRSLRAIEQQALCVHKVFEGVAAARSDHTAVVCGHERWSYARLNAEANRIAHTLIELGIQREEPVAIALPRSCEYIAAMLGVLKAGGAYVPIVDNQPVPRLRSMLLDSGARAILTRPDHLQELHTLVKHVLTSETCATQNAENPDRDCQPDDLAYILYTSGSTGEPKGVMIEHGGVHRLVHDQWFMPTGPDTNYLCVSSFGFDASTIEVYATLLHGATLAMTSSQVPQPDEVRHLLKSEHVRAVWIAFGFFGALFEADPDMFSSVGVIMTGGEPVSVELIRRAQRSLPETTFVNSYGPTECTALSTAYVIPELDDEQTGLVPIGRALRGMACSVQDAGGGEVEPGGQGELVISGIGIMRGYLNSPNLSKERLRIDVHGNRSFRSGDLVRLQPDGEIMFLGRIDSQVKVRGNRFELGEVESQTRKISWVDQCTACVISTESQAQLGLIVTPPVSPQDVDEIRSYLSSQLPRYMVPDVIVSRDAIPLTRNGKADRQQAAKVIESELPSPKTATRQASFSTDTQARLAGLMSDVLGCRVTSEHDRFLHLGGHSLKAIVLCSRIHREFGVKLPVSAVYMQHTVRELAERIQQSPVLPVGHQRSLSDADQQEAVPLSFNQQRLWMLDQINPGDPSYTITLRLEHDGELERSVFEKAWEWVCDRHDVMRSRVVFDESEARIEFDHALPGTPVWSEDVVGTPDEMSTLVERESMRGFDLEHGPLTRCRVFKGAGSTAVVISMHHIISDAWSCAILQRELSEAYVAFKHGREPAHARLETSYADFARAERELPGTVQYKADLEYWEQLLRGAPIVRLPADHPGGRGVSSRGIRKEIPIEPELMDQIHAAARKLGVTPFMYMLAIFKVWVHRLTLEQDLVVGVPIANRQMQGSQDLIGFFMETLALRDRVEPHRTLGETVLSIQQHTLEAFDRRDVPFQHIVEALGLQGQAGQNPLFEIFFNHIAIPLRNETAEKVLSFSDQDIDNHTAKFDLTCYVYEEETNARIVFNARRSKFCPTTVQWYLSLFYRTLAESVGHLETPISEIPIDVTPISEPHEARVPAPQLPMGRSTSGSITERIAQVVADHPTMIAVHSSGERLSYRDFWARAGAVAAALDASGVKAVDRVVIGTRDPIQTCIAVLGVLRLGGVFIPTDELWPAQRISTIIECAQPRAVLTGDSSDPCPRFEGIKINISGLSESVAAWEDRAKPGDPAYIMFTSGSTGTPKGVVQTHHAVVGHMVTFAHSIDLKAGQRIAQFSSFAFDAAIMDMFSCWLSGATLCVVEPRKSTPEEIAIWLDQHGVDVIHAAPTLLRWFTESSDEFTLRSVKAVVLGGEHAHDHDIDDVLSAFPNCSQLINGMGMTESSLTLQYRTDPNASVEWPSRLPVGFAVEGTLARLVHPDGRPSGPTGEIEIESDRIAPGYIEPFRPLGSPPSTDGTRRFRTGDIGMYRHDGSIMHLGRVDDQVQIRGCRVEPGEIADTIRSHASIHDAVVVANKSNEGAVELHAYVVSDPGLDAADLAEFCAMSLPAYMVPAQWHSVEEIPRVGGGKVDKHALSRLLPSRLRTISPKRDGEVNAQTRMIMEAFSSVLDIDCVGPDDHFFHLGGNSLCAIRLLAELRKSLNTDFPASIIYRVPTPRKLSEELDTFAQNADAERHLIHLRGERSDQRVLVLPGVGGHPLGFGPLIDLVNTQRFFVGVQYPNEQELNEIGRSLPLLAEWLIKKLNLEPGQSIPDLIGYSFGGSLALEVALQLRRQGHGRGRLLLLDAHLPCGLPKRGKIGTARAHLARIVEGHESSRIAYIKGRLSARQAPSEGGKAPPTESDIHEYRAISRINRQMVVEYEPACRYDGPVTLIRANQPEWLRFHKDDGYNGYSAFLDLEKVSLEAVNAGHLDLFKPAAVHDIARIVDRWLRSTPT